MIRIETGVTLRGHSLANQLVINDALHGAVTNILMCAENSAQHLSGEMATIRVEAMSINRGAPKPPKEVWQVRIIATLEDGVSVIPRSAAFYWLRPVLAGSSPYLSTDGVSPCRADLIFQKIFAPTKIPA